MKFLYNIILLLASQFVSAQTCNLSFNNLDSLPNGGIWLTATLSGPAPTYSWNTGASGPDIIITEPGIYQVTATNADGCTATGEYVAECQTYVRQIGTSMTAFKILGGTGLSYLWSTGETTQSIQPTVIGDYCVTVTGSNDCSGGTGANQNSNCGHYYSGYCAASITYNNDNTLTANANGTAPYTYAWSPGNLNTQTIAPVQPDYYNVTITDATGCISTAWQYLYDPMDCAVQITLIPDSSFNGGWLGASVPGGGIYDWQYEWSNGSISPSITATQGGNYCVTVTNIYTGCSASNCFWYWPDSLCWAEIHLDSTGIEDAFLSVTGNPFPIVGYQWSNGSTAAAIQTTTPGWHSVDITNSEGCTASATYYLSQSLTLDITAHLPWDSLPWPNDDTRAEFFLIEYDTAQGGILTAVDTVQSFYWMPGLSLGKFTDVVPGTYLLKAALLPVSGAYNDFLPAYYTDALLWSDATPITFKAFSWTAPKNIFLIRGQNPGGPGFIGGLVSQGANFHGGSGAEFSGSGTPVAGVTVILTLADGTPVASTVTDANGQYSFENLAWGSYVIILDIPGLPEVSTTVTLSPDNPTATNLNFITDENSIALPVKEVDLKKTIVVFPNPTQDVLFIETPKNADISLLDALGKEVLHFTGNNTKTKLSLQHLSSGTYFLTVRATGTIEIVKVIKQ